MLSGSLLIGVQRLDVQKEFGFFSLVIIQSVTADGSPTFTDGGCREEFYPTPHIHEQKTAYIMATTTSTLSQTR